MLKKIETFLEKAKAIKDAEESIIFQTRANSLEKLWGVATPEEWDSIYSDMVADYFRAVSHFTKIVNMTPHSVNVGDKVFQPSGQLARCEERWSGETTIEGATLLLGFVYGVTNLPPCDGETGYIVSLPVALAERDRTDLLIAVGQIRNESGQIIGAKGLAQI